MASAPVPMTRWRRGQLEVALVLVAVSLEPRSADGRHSSTFACRCGGRAWPAGLAWRCSVRDREKEARSEVGASFVSVGGKTSEFLGCEARRDAPFAASRNDDDRRDAGRSAAERRATAAGEGRARRDARGCRRSVRALGTRVARVPRSRASFASPARGSRKPSLARVRLAFVCGRTRRRERGVKRTSWGRSQPRWSPCGQRRPGHPGLGAL